MAKARRAASYSGLYEEGEVDYINGPHSPSHMVKHGANQIIKAKDCEESGVI